MEKIEVHLLHPCYECHKFFSSPLSVIRHINTIHGVKINRRKSGKNSPSSKAYIYVKSQSDSCITHYACPSCWFHCSENFDVFSHHVTTNHVQLASNSDDNEEMMETEKGDLEETVELNPVKNDKEATTDNKNREEKTEEILCILNDLITNFKNLMSDGGKEKTFM